MYLKAKNVALPDRRIVVRVDQCSDMSDVEIDKKWRETFLKSIENKGMFHPILVCKEDLLEKELYKITRQPFVYTGYMWRVFTGNNRFHYAKLHGYRLIDAYEIKSCEDWQYLNDLTFLEAKDM